MRCGAPSMFFVRRPADIPSFIRSSRCAYCRRFRSLAYTQYFHIFRFPALRVDRNVYRCEISARFLQPICINVNIPAVFFLPPAASDLSPACRQTVPSLLSTRPQPADDRLPVRCGREKQPTDTFSRPGFLLSEGSLSL